MMKTRPGIPGGIFFYRGYPRWRFLPGWPPPGKVPGAWGWGWGWGIFRAHVLSLSAGREAANVAEFVERVEREIGIKLQFLEC